MDRELPNDPDIVVTSVWLDPTSQHVGLVYNEGDAGIYLVCNDSGELEEIDGIPDGWTELPR